MKASEKYTNVFGSMNHLSNKIPWTTGLSNMVEFVVWNTSSVLGVSKKEYWKQIVDWVKSDELKDLKNEDVIKVIEKRLDSIMLETEQLETYSKKSTGICTAREALRRVKYFSEDYLNKEFDIFLSLVSDSYLDMFYKQFISFEEKNSWSTHGNSGLFECSTKLTAMFMDNLAYNNKSNILVANELKLNGKKNPDQILKYCLMYNYLLEHKFIEKDAKFLLLFIGGKEVQYEREVELNKEIEYCKKKNRHDLISQPIIEKASDLLIKSITWMDMMKFNETYLEQLDSKYQVEHKLIKGFNNSLNEKSFMQN
ncbi:MAG: hypothetical protein COB38_13005 [Gammaproteobacteria bacterium]|nr:MAG: hypothetical protein COB38_13005 [Gammaproteobacteria bacterium]